MQTEPDINTVKKDLTSFLIMEEIPLTANEDMDQMFEEVKNYVNGLNEEEAELQLQKETLWNFTTHY